MNLFDLLAISARRAPEKVALRFRGEDGRTTEHTYAALLQEAERTAAWLSRSIAKGDRVAFFLGNRPEFAVALLACLRLGAVVVPINLAYRREVLHIQGDARPRLFLLDAPAGDAAEVAALVAREPSEPAVERFLYAEEMAGWRADPALLPPRAAVAGDDLAMILYTSGTTGKSKGAMIRHGNVLATITGLLAAWSWERDDVLLLTLPLFHVHGLIVGLLTALAAGATVELRRKFDAAAAVDELGARPEGGGPTMFFGVPTMYVRLVDELRRRGPGADLSGLRLCCSGSAPLDPETFRAFRELTGQAILERYGMTETGMSLSNPYAGERLPGTVGVPLPGVSARIVDPEGRDVPPGGEGELLVRGSNVFSGYWQAPEKTAESFLQDPGGERWFRTGDLARRDPETGHYTLLGRRHELILSGGFNVYPREVEEVLASFPGIREAAVAGRPHPEWGEVPVAFLVADQEIDEAALIDHCKSQMAGFKVPRTVRFLESLPRNALGKVQKHLLPRT